ncbi:MAG: TetR/AcrR family transcriptional regulator, partial [Bdellovibrionales bacterium]|nr:TetR/AcrR family transcriptional regulator [Bdellovibrionales bacterium]
CRRQLVRSKNYGISWGMSLGQNDQPESPELGPRERILQASLKLFVEQGYFNTNVPDISKHSRCSVGSIYHHFLNKEEIASQLYQNGIDQFRSAITEAIKTDSDLESTIRDVVVSFLRFAEENRMLSQYIWLARHNEFLNHKVTRPTTVGFDSLGRKLTKIIKGGIRNGELSPLQAEVVWSILFGIPLSYVRDWLDGYTRSSPTEVAPVIASACYAALRGASPR